MVDSAQTLFGNRTNVEYPQKEVHIMAPENRDLRWRSIAEQLSNEADPTRSATLVGQLFQALDERDSPALATIVASLLPVNPASSGIGPAVHVDRIGLPGDRAEGLDPCLPEISKKYLTDDNPVVADPIHRLIDRVPLV